MSAWTDHDIATLKTMIGHGADYAVIAKVLKRTRPAIMGKAQKLGIRLAPEVLAEKRAKTLAAVNKRPESRARVADQTRSISKWCPQHRVSEYRRLIKSFKFEPSEAKRIILDDEAVQARRAARA